MDQVCPQVQGEGAEVIFYSPELDEIIFLVGRSWDGYHMDWKYVSSDYFPPVTTAEYSSPMLEYDWFFVGYV